MAAIIYVMDRDNSNSDPVVSERECLKLGDIVDVLEPKGNPLPNNGPFRLVLVKDVSVEQAQKYVAIHESGGEMLLRQIYMVDKSKMTPAQRESWDSQRYIETTVHEARKWLKNKLTGKYEG